MYLSTSLWGSMYTQYILSRSYVSQTHPFEKLGIPRRTFTISPALHTSMQFTWDVIDSQIYDIKFTIDVIVYNRCHKILIIDSQIYFMHTWFPKYQMINNIDSQIKIWVHNSVSYRKSYFCNHEAILILFVFYKWENLSSTYTYRPKPGHSHTTCHLDTIFYHPNSQLEINNKI